ncbi:MAG TPA: histidinol-phosphatase [Lentimicrobium sp.]|nr:histidinol-phosphatase [Lentimicrobium sp.]
MIPYNFHTHSKFSDGACAPEEYVIEAIKQDFKGLGFSEHSVLPFSNTFALTERREKEYCTEVARLKEKYKGEIEICLSLEADFIPGMSESMASLKQRLSLDYIIGSVHLVRESAASGDLWFIDGPMVQIYDDGINGIYAGDARMAVTAYWHQVNKMILEEQFDVAGHLDKVKMHNKGRWFSEEDDWYLSLVNETIELIAQKGLLVEINTRGLYKKRSDTFFPGDYILRQLFDKGIGIVVSSDAHHPSEISLCFDQAINKLKETGYRSSYVFCNNDWQEIALQ